MRPTRDYISLLKTTVLATAVVAIVATLAPSAAVAQSTLHGTVLDRETKQPIAFANVTLDTSETVMSTKDGYFDFGEVASGKHVIVFDHVSYERRSITITWPTDDVPIVVELTPSQYTTEKIVVTGERKLPSLPVSAIAIDRGQMVAIPGNIANDPLRTVQAQPSCAIGGIDFLSRMAVRGGDSEEHRVYFDGYPLEHYSHAGGFAGIVYDDMLASTVLVPGAAPIRYNGTLSGIVLFKPIKPDTSFRSFRYDITSMAGGISQVVNRSLAVQIAAKSSFFNLPVYQQVGVSERSFNNVFGRVIVTPGKSFGMTATLMAAKDSETGDGIRGDGSQRNVRSALAGVELSYRRSAWGLKVRPSYSYYESRDELTWPQGGRAHELRDARLQAGIDRQGAVVGLGLSGEFGSIHHTGSGGTQADEPYAASAELRLKYREIAAVALGAGGSKEPWTADVEPEGYGSARVHLGRVAEVSAGFRRSHQSPFLFSRIRYFASIPIDAGDLMNAYSPSWREATAVRMDQASAGAVVNLPLRISVEGNAYERWYEHLPTWQWDSFPGLANAGSEGTGRGYGYEVALTRNDPEFLSIMVALSRAKVWKTEGTLDEERPGDYDRPESWQAGFSLRVTKSFRFSMRYLEAVGRPYTLYDNQDFPPPSSQVNALRMRDYRRVDIKLVYMFLDKTFDGELFLDMVNFMNYRNITMMPALETTRGSLQTVRYGGTRFFPIAGVTFRW